jgi:hypothetical protein
MNDTHLPPQPKAFFGPRDLLLNAVVLHILACLILAPFVMMALFMSHPHQFGALVSVAIFVWAWRSRQWLPSILFLLSTIGFWLAVILPWRGYNQ